MAKARAPDSFDGVTVRSSMPMLLRCQTAVALPSTYTGFFGRSRARSARTMTYAPAPSVTRQQSCTVKGSETMRAASTSSIVSGPRANASGLSCAQRRAATATSASWRRVVPYWCMWRAARSA